MRTLSWETVGRTVLAVHGRRMPDEAEWQAFIDHCMSGVGLVNQGLVFANVALTAPQRRQIAAVHKATGTQKVAVVTDSMLTRLLVNMMNWLSNTHRAFALSEVDAAFTHLAVSDAERQQLVSIARRFALELDLPQLDAALALQSTR